MTPDELVHFYKSREEFDPFAHAREVREHPEKHVHMSDIRAAVISLRQIRHAPSMEALKTVFRVPARKAKDAGDAELLHLLTEAKNTRKEQLC